MGEIIIEPGDTQKIVSQPGPSKAYNLSVTGADVFLSHNSSRTVAEGDPVRLGDRVKLRNLNGQSVYAKNPPENTTNAVLTLSEAGFDVLYQVRESLADVVDAGGERAPPATSDPTNPDPRNITTKSSESLDYNVKQPSGNIAAGDSEEIVIRPPEGEVWEIHTATVNVPDVGGASTDFHSVEIQPENASMNLLNGGAKYDTYITYQYGRWNTNMTTRFPSDSAAALQVLQGMRIDHSNGIEFTYYNNTDGTQTSNRQYRIYSRKIDVAE